jgi:hypothetical protein
MSDAAYEAKPHDRARGERLSAATRVDAPRPKQSQRVESPSTTGSVAAREAARRSSGDESIYRQGLVGQLQEIPKHLLGVAKSGHERAERAMKEKEAPSINFTQELLAAAATAALAAATGGAAGIVARSIISAGASKLVADLVKSSVTKAVNGAFDVPKVDLEDVHEAYLRALDLRIQTASAQLVHEWARVHVQLHALPTEELERASAAAQLGPSETGFLIEDACMKALIGWANFLARAKHGTMPGFDHWEEHGSKGAIALRGARDPRKQPPENKTDTTAGNVDPKSARWMLAQRQRGGMAEHYGILEIFVDSYGRVIDIPGYRMRLDNVGPNVRKELRTLGTVRELAINKVVRLCSYVWQNQRVNPPITIASAFITADGYVRAYDWSQFQRMVHTPEPKRHVLDIKGSVGRCIDQLIVGEETPNCHFAGDHMRAEVTQFAEAAQDLPLSYLKVAS